MKPFFERNTDFYEIPEKYDAPEKGDRLICLPTQHWSQRITQGRNRSLWASWLLITPEVTLYFGGDTGYFKGFAEFGRRERHLQNSH